MTQSHALRQPKGRHSGEGLVNLAELNDGFGVMMTASATNIAARRRPGTRPR